MNTMTPDHEARLSNLAELAVRVGVNVQPGQELIVTAPIEAAAFVQRIARSAYERGAKLVTCLYDDPTLMLCRFEYAGEDTLDAAATWLSRGVTMALEDSAARLFVAAPYPDLLTGIPTERVLRMHGALARATASEARFTAESLVNWSVVPFVTDSWARAVFPALSAEDARARLWSEVFHVMRADDPAPLDAWAAHCRALDARREALQASGLRSLHLRGPGTDLEVGLVHGHRWIGGTVVAANGIAGVSNMPTEEVFTCPHRERTRGQVAFSRPLAIAGTIVEDLRVEFREGVAVAVHATRGQDTFRNLLDADEGARRLGEIGLVPESSRVSACGTLFLNALLDENAASHVAFGQSYAACTSDTPPRDAPSRLAMGANQSSLHVDCMFGHARMDIDGVRVAGDVVPLMRDGEFVI